MQKHEKSLQRSSQDTTCSPGSHDSHFRSVRDYSGQTLTCQVRQFDSKACDTYDEINCNAQRSILAFPVSSRFVTKSTATTEKMRADDLSVAVVGAELRGISAPSLPRDNGNTMPMLRSENDMMRLTNGEGRCRCRLCDSND